jgi:hypothetical protein
MSKSLHCALGTALLLPMSGAVLAATPALTEQRAARGVNTAVVTYAELLQFDSTYVAVSREVIDIALDQLNAATSFPTLLAPGGVTLNCPVSGTLSARISNPRLRTLKLEWFHCVSVEYGTRNDVDGPAEVALGENSLQPGMILSIRLGELNRDYVVDSTPEIPSPTYGGQTISRNLRVTGPMPTARAYKPGGNFLGRYLVETQGFYRRVQRLPSYDPITFEPSVELYNYSNTFSTDGALLTGNYTVNGTDNQTETALITGKFSSRFDYPVRPGKPARTLDMWFKGTGLSTRFAWNNAASRYSVSVDGKLEGDFNQFFPLGCTGADTYTFHTRSPLIVSPYAYYFEFFEGGELVIDGKAVATFSATGTEPYVDLLGHVLLKVPGVGTFNYDYTDYILEGPLANAGRCTP